MVPKSSDFTRASGAIFSGENGGSQGVRTVCAQKPKDNGMTFPVTVPDRKAEAIIYGRSEAYPYYRVCWNAAGKRLMQSCKTYKEAYRVAKAKAKALSKGNQSLALSAKEASDMLAIREALHAFIAVNPSATSGRCSGRTKSPAFPGHR